MPVGLNVHIGAVENLQSAGHFVRNMMHLIQGGIPAQVDKQVEPQFGATVIACRFLARDPLFIQRAIWWSGSLPEQRDVNRIKDYVCRNGYSEVLDVHFTQDIPNLEGDILIPNVKGARRSCQCC